MLRRALIVIAAYGLSLGAWVAHVRMSFAWIRNLSLSRRWPLWGFHLHAAGSTAGPIAPSPNPRQD